MKKEGIFLFKRPPSVQTFMTFIKKDNLCVREIKASMTLTQ